MVAMLIPPELLRTHIPGVPGPSWDPRLLIQQWSPDRGCSSVHHPGPHAGITLGHPGWVHLGFQDPERSTCTPASSVWQVPAPAAMSSGAAVDTDTP